MPEATAAGLVRVLRPRRGWQRIDLAELWRYRDLLVALALRDVQVRYKQTALGVAWAVIQPLVTMVVFSVLFGQLLNLAQHTDGVPYPIFLFAGLLPWTFFSATVTASSNALVNNAAMIQKVYFPRLLMPIAAAGAPLIDYAVASVVLLGMMAWYGVTVSWPMLLLPALAASTVLPALGVGVLVAGLNVSYRDFRHVVPFLIQVWFYLTPVLVPVSVAPPRYQWLVHLNPLAGTISAFRSAVLGTPIDLGAWSVSLASSLGFAAVALAYFSRAERRFADVI